MAKLVATIDDNLKSRFFAINKRIPQHNNIIVAQLIEDYIRKQGTKRASKKRTKN